MVVSAAFSQAFHRELLEGAFRAGDVNKTAVPELINHLQRSPPPPGHHITCGHHVSLGSPCCDSFSDFHCFDDLVSFEENRSEH
ncbi:hypothetical protein PRBEI_2001833600 [Prionailurus iriomotensis]